MNVQWAATSNVFHEWMRMSLCTIVNVFYLECFPVWYYLMIVKILLQRLLSPVYS